MGQYNNMQVEMYEDVYGDEFEICDVSLKAIKKQGIVELIERMKLEEMLTAEFEEWCKNFMRFNYGG